MSARPFTVFRAVPGVLDFVPVARINAASLPDAMAEAERIVPAPIVCHGHTGEREAVDFSLIPAPTRRSRRHA